jgi:hypothetical protein
MNTNIKEVFDDMKFDDPEHRKMFIESYNELWESHEKMKKLLKRSHEVMLNFLKDIHSDDIHHNIDLELLKYNKIKKIL